MMVRTSSGKNKSLTGRRESMTLCALFECVSPCACILACMYLCMYSFIFILS